MPIRYFYPEQAAEFAFHAYFRLVLVYYAARAVRRRL